MENQVKFSCILLGGRSLLAQCGDLLLANGHMIKAVISDDLDARAWADTKQIPGYTREEALSAVQKESFDYLFSIVNLHVLDKAIIEAPKLGAINFHDGPLPDYAGLNTPTWALLNGAQEYGITWHKMLDKVDEGEIYIQKRFPIAEEESSLTLNVKCFEKAFEGFQELLAQIEQGSLAGSPQDLSKINMFYRSDRPELGAWLDWKQSASQLAQIVRALDYGDYENPVATARTVVGGRVVIVKSVDIVEDQSGEPGLVLGSDETGVTIAAGEGALLISRCVDAYSGEAVDLASIKTGETCLVLSDQDKDELQAKAPIVGKKEPFWLKRMASLQEFDSPIRLSGEALSKASADYQSITLPEVVSGGPEATLAMLGAFWARLAKSDHIDLPVSFLPQNSGAAVTKGFVSALPLGIDLKDDPNGPAMAARFEEQLVLLGEKATFTTDFFVRHPHLGSLPKHWVTGKHAISFVIAEEAAELNDLSAAFNMVWEKSLNQVRIIFDPASVTQASVERYLAQFEAFSKAVHDGESPVTATLLTEQDIEQLTQWNSTDVEFQDTCVHQLIEQQAIDIPDAPALACGDVCLSYSELNQKANQVARHLIEKGVSLSDRVGILMDRSENMVVSMIAAWKAGASYVPLDPTYPVDRIQYMISDSHLAAIVTEAKYRSQFEAAESVAWIEFAAEKDSIEQLDASNLDLEISPTELAYTIYTSGSTGKPKGVMVEHHNAVNFFVGMDDRIESDQPGTWLAVTSISFDISVLELFWTLSRGFKVVVYQDEKKAIAAGKDESGMDFSLFYWNVAGEAQKHAENKYKLLLESAKFGDKNGFSAVWTPERHFASFGALFPNPAVTSAALATITENIDIRAGSCVAPLHSPIRIAEDWSVVDNLSNGRVGIAMAAGWAPTDFAIKPESFSNAKQLMFEHLETVRALWRGESRTFQGGTGEVEVSTLPRPIQKELRAWITTAGNIDSYLQAAEHGAGILTHLLGQSVEEVGEKVAAYRKRWKECGHPGEGHVVVMLHTLIGESAEEVEKHARGPMKEYLKSAMFLVKQAAWNFPIYKKMSEEQGKSLDELFETLSEDDFDQILDFAFERYYQTSGLFGTPESALEMVKAVKAAGANEIGCLIDFGMDGDIVLEHLPYLKQLLDKAKDVKVEVEEDAIPASMEAQFSDHDVTHFQCTPSMATMLAHEPSLQAQLAKLKQMMVGGEAMPPQLAAELSSVVPGRVTNMYGPTETTIWSSTQDVGATETVAIGKPIANTKIFIVDEHMQPLPTGSVGEIVICGKGVVRGYHERPDLNAERFIELSVFGETHKAYRTGDLGRWQTDGTLQCLGRQDHQVKIRGYRIELGEIESILRDHPKVLEAAVDVIPERQQLAAFYRVGAESPTSKELEDFLSEKLPEFMVPAFYKELKVIPQTPNGKIDRKSLPKTNLDESGVESSVAYVAPTSELETQVADIWKQALGVNAVGINDNFFDIGGHSILALQVLQELRKITDKSLQMTDLFKYTTVSTMATFLASDEKEAKEKNKVSSRGAARKAAMNRRRVRRK